MKYWELGLPRLSSSVKTEIIINKIAEIDLDVMRKNYVLYKNNFGKSNENVHYLESPFGNMSYNKVLLPFGQGVNWLRDVHGDKNDFRANTRIALGQEIAEEIFVNELIEKGDADAYVMHSKKLLNDIFADIFTYSVASRVKTEMKMMQVAVHPDNISDFMLKDRILELVWFVTGNAAIGKGVSIVGKRIFNKVGGLAWRGLNKLPVIAPAKQPGNLISSYFWGKLKGRSLETSYYKTSPFFTGEDDEDSDKLLFYNKP